MSLQGVQYAGEYEVSHIRLISSSGTTLPIEGAVVQLDFMEDIFTNSIFGAISVVDTNDLVHNMPIVGQEFLDIKIKTPTLNDEIDNIFSVIKINKYSDVNQGAKLFELHFTSLEFVRNNRIRVSKSFTGTTSEIVQDLLENEQFIGTKKNINIEETIGIKKVVSPNLNPYRLIRNLTSESIAKNSGSPHFLFYETLKGINFRTVQNLYDEESSGTFDAGVSAARDINFTKVIDDMRRVISQDAGGYNDMMQNIKSGVMGSSLIMHDIYNKNYQKYDYKYFQNFGDFGRIDENPIYNEVLIDDFNNTVGDFPEGKIYVHPTSTTTDFLDAQHYDTSSQQYAYTSNKTQNTLQYRRSKYMELMGGVSLTLEVNGHTALEAGQMVDFFRDSTGKKIDDGIDKYFSGRFLISSLRHTFSNNFKKHEITMLIVKDSFPSSIPVRSSAKPPRQRRGFTTNLTTRG